MADSRTTKRHSSSLILFALTICCLTQTVNAAENATCSVEEMRVVPAGMSDPEFVAKNMRKQFLVTVKEKQIFVTQLSSDFENSQDIYTIVNRSILDIYSAKITSMSIDILVIGKNLDEGTLVIQSSTYANVWRLNCQRT